jgi:hypothetical protein
MFVLFFAMLATWATLRKMGPWNANTTPLQMVFAPCFMAPVYHFICLTNLTPHARSDKSPHKLRMGSQPDFSLLRTFGCHVYVKPPHSRDRIHCSFVMAYHSPLLGVDIDTLGCVDPGKDMF